MALAKYMGITSKPGNNALQSSMVHGFSAPDKPVECLSDKWNMELPVICKIPWIMNNVQIGSYVPASVLKQVVPGLHQLPDIFLHGKWIRQLDQGQVDTEGNDIGGFFVLSDVATVVLFEKAKHGCQYANNTNQVNSLRAPSLKYIDSGHANVSFFESILFDLGRF